jgi:hypothetical protein
MSDIEAHRSALKRQNIILLCYRKTTSRVNDVDVNWQHDFKIKKHFMLTDYVDEKQ